MRRRDFLASLSGGLALLTAFHPENAHLVGGELPLRIPERAEPFHSGFLGLDAGSVFEHGFPIEGVYDYLCQPHYGFGMVGRIIAGEPRGGPAVTGSLETLPEAARAELPAIDAILGPPGRGFEWASRLNGVLLLRVRAASPPSPDALVEAASADDGLREFLGGGRRDRFLQAAKSFLEAAARDIPYEELVRMADVTKALLEPADA